MQAERAHVVETDFSGAMTRKDAANSLYETLARKIAEENCACSIPAFSSGNQDTCAFLSEDCRTANTIIISETAKITAPEKITIKGTGNLLIVGDNVALLNTAISFEGDGGCILIGEKSSLREASVAVRGNGGAIAIGRKFAWRGGSISCASEGTYVLVGDDCMFAAHVNIRTSDGHVIVDRATQQRLNKPAPVVVHEHVWLASGARLGKGVTVGAGSVVGQGAIVSSSVEPACVYAGIPARKLRENVVWTRGTAYESIPARFK